MRAYFFSNMYLSGIHTGIQAGHAIDQMWLKYTFQATQIPQLHMLRDFSTNHKTFIILNGGDHDALAKMVQLFEDDHNPFPWHFFKEPGLNNAFTSVSIILPERLYDETAQAVGRGLARAEARILVDGVVYDDLAIDNEYTLWEKKLLVAKSNCGLAS